MRLNPRPDVSELSKIYPPEYYAYNYEPSDGGPPTTLTDRLKARFYQDRIEALVNALAKPGPVRLLDIGCGDGRLLNWYRSSTVGERLETHGIELNERAAERARAAGHEVVVGRFECDTELEADSYDVIVALHVIEHVDDPAGFARRAAELLRPGGILSIATPNWDSSDARRFRGDWGGNHFPRHWTLYDERTLGELAASVGLEMNRVEYQPNPIFWVWSLHSSLRHRFPGRRWPDRLFPPVRIFNPSLHSLVLLTAFTLLDRLQTLVTGRTSSILVDLRKAPG
ncbi:MAG: class I SAM-dependent methyltransferase [Actinomycetota bacterium]|nr:class I SAM-dependent methyltransferase [Actinomycetota bacterium]